MTDRDKVTSPSAGFALAGYPLFEAEREALARTLHDRLQRGGRSVLLYANTNFVVQCRHLLPQLRAPDVLIVNDGVGMDIASLLLRQQRFKDNLNGTDFTPYFFAQASAPMRVFLLGGKPEVIGRAAAFVSGQLGQVVVGTCDGYGGMRQAQDLVSRINDSHADVVLVAMGNPLQEQWILDHYRSLDAGLVSGVGALFDFWAGDKPRAPLWVRNLRMEWCYRLCLEPKRLFKRYTIDIVAFLLVCLRYRASQ